MKILKAWWFSSSRLCLVLDRDLNSPPLVELKSEAGFPDFNVERIDKWIFAKYTSYFIDGGKVCFMMDSRMFANIPENRGAEYYVCGDFNGWEKAIGDAKWKLEGGKGFRRLIVDIADISFKRGVAFFKFASSDRKWIEPPAYAPNSERDSSGNLNFRLRINRTWKNAFVLRFSGMCDIRKDISINLPEFGVSATADAGELLLQIYSASRLGAHISGDFTEFSIFAPRAESAQVQWWFENKADARLTVDAESRDGVVWKARIPGNLSGARYFWRLSGASSESGIDARLDVADPYANAMLSSSGPSIVKFDSDLPHCEDSFTPPPWHDLAIMEIHLRDVLSLAPIELSTSQRRGFEGLSHWLKSEDCYIRQAGVNCVELQPVHEFTAADAGDYEWGYMPVNWFAPASSYATDAASASQNADFFKLVRAFHKAGIAVILDVVYNHCGEPNFLAGVDREYYFETDNSGNFTNFSGCGNDFRASTPMGRRMILDSLKKMVLNYGVDGFRFDLAELIGLDVLVEIESELKKLRPSIILIAEPWSFRGHMASALFHTGYSYWNDGFREFMLRYAKGEGNFEGFKYYMRGSLGHYARWPAQTVNYLESHDDMCLFDRISSTPANPTLSDLRRYKLAYASVILSIGIPMLAEGFDLVRTKGGKSNTYKDGLANELDYARAVDYPGTSAWLRGLVRFRLSESAKALRLRHSPSERYFVFMEANGGKSAAVLYNANRETSGGRVFAAFNPDSAPAEFEIGDFACELSNFRLVADSERVDIRGLPEPLPRFCAGKLRVPALGFFLFAEY